MRRRWIFPFILASGIFAQDGSLKTWFPDGTGLEIRTASSGGKSPLSTEGAVAVSPGNDVHRMVVDNEGKMLFAYDIEAKKSAQGMVALTIKPVDQVKIRREGWFPKDKVAPGAVPTLAAARDFPPLRAGDAVEVDILYHPVTGERIYDVLRVSTEPPPQLKPNSAKPRGDQFSFQEVRAMLNGRIIREPQNNWIIGPVAMIYVPNRGPYYLSLSPTPDVPFQAAGWVDHAILRFKIGEDLIEIFSKSNVLQKSDFGTVWVYHEPLERPVHRGFEIQTADDVESLIPRKKPKEE